MGIMDVGKITEWVPHLKGWDPATLAALCTVWTPSSQMELTAAVRAGEKHKHKQTMMHAYQQHTLHKKNLSKD